MASPGEQGGSLRKRPQCMFCRFPTAPLIKAGKDKYAHTTCIARHKAGMKVPFKLEQLRLGGYDDTSSKPPYKNN